MAAGAGAAAQVRDTEPSPAEAFRSVIGPGQIEPGGVVGEADTDGVTVLDVGSVGDGVGVAVLVGAGEVVVGVGVAVGVGVGSGALASIDAVADAVGVAVSEGIAEVGPLDVDVDCAKLLEFGVGELVGIGVGDTVETTGTTGSTHAGGMARAASLP